MEDAALKNRIILILAVLCALLAVTSISSCSDARKQKRARDSEMVKRMDAEEKLSKTSQDKTLADDRLTKLTKELEAEKSAHEVTKKALTQEQLVAQSIKDEIEKISKQKDALEDKLKNALDIEKAASKMKR